MFKGLKVPLVIVLAIAFAGWLVLPGSAAAVQVGDVAPDFELPASTGGPITLKDFKGISGNISLSQFRGKQMVLIEFYHADFGPT